MPKTPQKIYGWVDLSEQMRTWIRDQIINHGQLKLGLGWKVIPAHFRPNPTKQIIQYGYPDTSDSNLYWFDNPEKRDRNGELIREPLPLKSERDKEYFKEENALMFKKYGFYRYEIFSSRKNYVEEYDPDRDYVQRHGSRDHVHEDITGTENDFTVPKNFETPPPRPDGLDENGRLKKGFKWEGGRPVKVQKKEKEMASSE